MRSSRHKPVVNAVMISLRRARHVYDQAWETDRRSLAAWLIEDAGIELDCATRMVRQLPRTPRYAHLRAALRRVPPVRGGSDLYRVTFKLKKVVDEAELIRQDIELSEVWAAQRSAESLARWAACLLPVRNRMRYQEEFEAELFELAQRSRIRQLRHIVRIVVRTVPLRRELRRAVRERVR